VAAPGTGVREAGDEAIRIRRATLEDCTALAGVLSAAFAEFRHQYTDQAYRVTTPGVAEIAARFDEGPVWIALHGKEAIGTVSGILGDRGLYVRSMGVVPAGRGHGIGRRLLEHAEEFASAHRCRRMELSTTPFLTQAIRLYQQFGFIGCGTRSLCGTPLIVMEKVLRGAGAAME
jgi:GNAT superfamily N-acetyltransferase